MDDDIEDSGYVEAVRPNDVLVVTFEFSTGDLMADTQGTSIASPYVTFSCLPAASCG